MPKALITTEEREPLLAIAGRIAATVYGIPQAEATQGVRQASDALRKFGIDGTPTDWVLLSRAREGGATPDEVEAFAKTARDLRAKR